MTKIEILIPTVRALEAAREFLKDEKDWRHGNKPVMHPTSTRVSGDGKSSLLEAVERGAEAYSEKLAHALDVQGVIPSSPVQEKASTLANEAVTELGKEIKKHTRMSTWCYSWIGVVQFFNAAPTTTHSSVLALLDMTIKRLSLDATNEAIYRLRISYS